MAEIMSRSSQGVSRLLSAMKKLIVEVNDQEICRRLEILMNSEKEDLPQPIIRRIIDTPNEVDAREVPEPYTQYVKHYLYMLKRDARDKRREPPAQADEEPRAASKKKSASSKKTRTSDA